MLFIISLLDVDCVVFPDFVTPILMGGQIFYILDFSQVLAGFECLQDSRNSAELFGPLRAAVGEFAGYYNNVSVRSYYLTNLTAASTFVRVGEGVPRVVFSGIPTAFNPPQRHKFFIYTNLYLEYSL